MTRSIVPPASGFKRLIAEGFIAHVCEELVDFAKPLQDEDPHIVLSLYWLNRKRRLGLEKGDDSLFRHAMPVTCLISCIDLKDCPQALGIQLFADEHPSYYADLPSLKKRFILLMSPALDACIEGRFASLYAQKNPSLVALLTGASSNLPGRSEEHER
jgi:hypothetical protein